MHAPAPRPPSGSSQQPRLPLGRAPTGPRRARGARALAAWLLPLLLPACSVAVHSAPLSGRPGPERGIYLSTGGAPRPFRTLGFLQVRGYGTNVAGIADVGDVALDGAVRGTLASEALRMGGDGVVNIEFLDENPVTPAERAAALSNSVSGALGSGPAGVQTKERTVLVTGEVVQFLDP